MKKNKIKNVVMKNMGSNSIQIRDDVFEKLVELKGKMIKLNEEGKLKRPKKNLSYADVIEEALNDFNMNSIINKE